MGSSTILFYCVALSVVAAAAVVSSAAEEAEGPQDEAGRFLSGTIVHQKFVKFTCGYRKKSVMVRGHQKASNLPENSLAQLERQILQNTN